MKCEEKLQCQLPPEQELHRRSRQQPAAEGKELAAANGGFCEDFTNICETKNNGRRVKRWVETL